MHNYVFNVTVIIASIYLSILWIKTYKTEKALIIKSYKQLKPQNINKSNLNNLIRYSRMQAIVYTEAIIVGCLLAILGYNNFEVIMQSAILRVLFILTGIITLSKCVFKLIQEKDELKKVKRYVRTQRLKRCSEITNEISLSKAQIN